MQNYTPITLREPNPAMNTIMPANKTKINRTTTQRIGLYLGLFLFFTILLFFDFEPDRPAVTRMAAVTALMATWWVTEAIPLFATALLPMILFPVLGILKGSTTAPIYINSTIFLFLGGFMIALTMEKWNLHKRIALRIIRLIGGGPSRIVMGFMATAAFLSMWISNTATAIMMVPIFLAVIYQMEAEYGTEATHNFTIALMLGVAYACSVGGIATLVGTPPNLSFTRIFAITFPDAKPISFGQWILMGLPVSAIMIGIIWFLLTKVFFRIPPAIKTDRSIIDKQYQELGSMSFEEKSVLTVFSITAVLWVFRENLSFGFFTLPGWSQLLPYPDLIDDGTVGLTMAMILFLIPSRSNDASSPTVMGADVVTKLPWNVVLLFGGGFALAKGFQTTGLSAFIGNKFTGLAGVSPFLMVILLCLTITFLTELTSNTASTQMILPILASVSLSMQINPLILMIPATFSASCAFMLPVATPPNAIIFGSGRIKIAEMARVGFIINIIGVMVISILFYTIGTRVFSIDLGVFPAWAQSIGAGYH